MSTSSLFPPLPPERHITPEEVEESFEFQTIKRILKREYPWVLDLNLGNDRFLNKYDLVFLTMTIDPYKLQKEKGWEILPYVIVSSFRDDWFQPSSLNYIFNITEEMGKEMDNELTQVAKDVSESPHLPDELKYLSHKNRRYYIQSYKVPPDYELPIPDDVIMSQPDFSFDYKWYIKYSRQKRNGG